MTKIMLQQASILLEWNKLQRKDIMHGDGHTTSKRKMKKKIMGKDCKTSECKVKGKIMMEINCKLQTKTTKHNLKAKKFKKRQVANKHHHMQDASQK